jgi:glyoxylase-like metal-dependent hydrolase (beta-lactamase superfamily II)
LVFPNAKIWSNRAHWDWAVNPNVREKVSFLTENLLPIEQSGHLEFIAHGEGVVSTPLGFDVLFVDGHTEKQMIPMIPYKGETLVFMADLLPTAGHIPVPYVMGYDTRPLLTMKEKLVFLQEAADKDLLLFLEHDVYNPLVRVQHTEKGVRLKSKHSLDEYF